MRRGEAGAGPPAGRPGHTEEEEVILFNEICEIHNNIQGLKLDNNIHAAKIERAGGLHILGATEMQTNIKA